MRIRSLFLAAIASATLVGCGSPGRIKPFYFDGFSPFVKTVHCTTQDCSLTVTVTENSATGTCVLDVADILNVKLPATGDRNLTWTIATDGYEFSKEAYKYGIFIKSDPDDEFKNVQITGNGKSLSIQFKHQRTGIDYSYALSVRRTNKTFCETLDPWLIT
jgi:hypothetical protein